MADQFDHDKRLSSLEKTAASLEATTTLQGKHIASIANSVDALRGTVADGFNRLQTSQSERSRVSWPLVLSSIIMVLGIGGLAGALITTRLTPIETTLHDHLSDGGHAENRILAARLEERNIALAARVAALEAEP